MSMVLDSRFMGDDEYLSISITRTPHSFASRSNATLTHLDPNIGLQNSMTGSVVSVKLLVVEYVTRSLPWEAFSGSQKHWWRCLAHSRSMACSVAVFEPVSEVDDWDGADILIAWKSIDFQLHHCREVLYEIAST